MVLDEECHIIIGTPYPYVYIYVCLCGYIYIDVCVCALCPPRYRLHRWGVPLGPRGQAWLDKHPGQVFPPPPAWQPPPGLAATAGTPSMQPVQPLVLPPPAWQPPPGSAVNFPNAWGLTQCTRPPPVDGLRGMGITIRPPAGGGSFQMHTFPPNPSWSSPSHIFGNQTQQMPNAVQCMLALQQEIAGLRQAVDILNIPS